MMPALPNYLVFTGKGGRFGFGCGVAASRLITTPLDGPFSKSVSSVGGLMPRDLVAFFATLVLAVPMFGGPPRPVAAPRIDLMTGSFSRPAIAQGATDRTMIVWTVAEEQGCAIYAAEAILRLGYVADVPRRVADASEFSDTLVAPTSVGYFAVWGDCDGIHGASVEPAFSTYYPAQPIVPNAWPLAIATSDERMLVIYARPSGSGWSLGGAFLSERGEVERVIDLAAVRGFPRVALAPTAEGFLIAFSEQLANVNPLFVRRVVGSDVSDPLQVDVAGFSESFALATSPAGALLVWGTGTPGGALVARHLDSAGAPASQQFALGVVGTAPAVTWTGSDYFVSFATGVSASDVHGLFVSADTNEIRRRIEIAATPKDEGAPAVTSDGATTSVVWLTRAVPPQAPYFGVINAVAMDSGGGLLSPAIVSHSHTNQDAPSAVSARGVSLVAWTEQTGAESQSVFFGRIDADGRPLDGSGVSLKSGFMQWEPQVATDSDKFLIAWIEERGAEDRHIFAQRVEADGSAVGNWFEITEAAERSITALRVVWAGTEYVAVWADEALFPPHGDGLWIARVLPTGVVRERRFVQYDDAQLPMLNLSVAVGQNGLLVTSDNQRDCFILCPPHRSEVFALALDENAAPIRGPVSIARNASRAGAAFLGNRYLVAYAGDEVTMGEYLNHVAIPVSEPFVVHPSPAAYRTSVISDGAGFVVAADVGGYTHFPILATLRGSDVVSIAMLAEGSVRANPSPRLFDGPQGIRVVFRAFDPELAATRLFTRELPEGGIVDVGVSIELESGSVHGGSSGHATVHVGNLGSRPAENIEALVDFGSAVVSGMPEVCSAPQYGSRIVCRVQRTGVGGFQALPFEFVTSYMPGEQLSIKAAAYAFEQDGALANNVATVNVDVSPPLVRRRAIRK